MVHEYRKLSQTFNEIKAENGCSKNSSVESSIAQLGDTDSLQTDLSKLKIENDLLRTKSCELSSENERLSQLSTDGRLQPMAGSQNLKADQEQIQLNNSGHGICEYMGATHSSQHTAPDAKHSSTCFCPTHEVWELPTLLIVANRSQQGDEVYGSYPIVLNRHPAIPSNTDLTLAKPNTDTSSGKVAQKLRIGSYKLNQIYPTLLKQQKALNKAQDPPNTIKHGASHGSIHIISKLGLRDEGIDQLNFHSAQLGYLKLLQIGTQTQQDKAGNKYEVKPQYEELSKQINMQHATNQCYECMRAIKKSDS
ncbi:hypothetical protein F511_12048 [Dorcoceras hygrometricum]|uniref:Uncharacterized protein n=1 Tax=Dorcoceras hygrometricum TaxID=472368 RepID=A0A2Z7D8N6_9LAMI|nr:hypothetical protein F511_12048 [Dorcoceras hygrometricum]